MYVSYLVLHIDDIEVLQKIQSRLGVAQVKTMGNILLFL